VSASVLYMSMSLDGYIAGPNDEPGNPGGDGFDRLHEWITTPDGEYGRPSGPAGELFDEWDAAGAVLAGRRTVEQVDHWGGDNHDGVPIFVPSHRPPGPSVANYPLVTYVTDGIASAMTQAKAAAGDRKCWCRARTPRNGRWRPGCWTSCRFARSRCCSVVAVGCSRCCHRASSWRSSG
jgi:dihydrofolate reductase